MPIARNVALLALFLAGCSKDCTVTEGKASGRLESTGTTGPWVLSQGNCYSGEREGFYGVTVEGGGDAAVMFVENPSGDWVVKARLAGTCNGGKCRSKIFTKEECKTLDIDLKLEPSRQTQFFDGTATVDCTVEGSHVFGTLKMEACRSPMGK